MAVKLIIAPEAQQDIDEAYTWYENRSGKDAELRIESPSRKEAL